MDEERGSPRTRSLFMLEPAIWYSGSRVGKELRELWVEEGDGCSRGCCLGI